MKFKFKKPNLKNDSIRVDVLLVELWFLVTSWEILIPLTYFDELILGLIILWNIIKKRSCNKKIVFSGLLYAVYCVFGALVNLRINTNVIFYIFDNLKPLLVLGVMCSLRISNSNIKKIFIFFERINLISILIGILNSYNYYRGSGALLFDAGNRREVNGVFQYRMNGLVKHTGTMATICVVLICITLFKKEKTRTDYIKICVYLMGLVLTRGRFNLILSLLIITIYIYKKFFGHFTAKTRHVIIVVVIIAVIIVSFPGIIVLKNYFAFDLQHQIRFVAIRSIWTFIRYVVFFGVGAGNIGTDKSAIYNHDLYSRFGLTHWEAMDWESTLAKQLLQTGIVGTVIYYYPFVYVLRKIIRSNGEYHKVAEILFSFYLIQTLINKAYDLPLIGVVAILASNQMQNFVSKKGCEIDE